MPQRIAALILCLCLALSAGAASAAEPRLADYQATPYWIAPRSVPMVLLVLSKDQKMFRHAYSPGDHDGDGDLDIGFNPETKYLGYHDSESCYKYSNGSFYRSGPATDKGSDARGVPSGLYIPAPKNAYGVCNGTSGEWHGNWLNFVMTSRIDAIKKVLYGGTRYLDTAPAPGKPGETVLEHSYIPSNALVWGYDIMGDDVWNQKTGHLPYYNADDYIGIGKPDADRMHFFARYTDGYSSESLTKPPLLRVLFNIPAGATNRDGTQFRVWNWTVLGENSIPSKDAFNAAKFNGKDLNIDDYNTSGGSATDPTAYNARVNVCAGDAPPDGEGCKQYPAGNFKPIGLLQQYGEKKLMNFGLMTGVAQQAAKRRGGVIRHHINPIDTMIHPETGVLVAKDNPAKPVDRADTTTSNLIRTIDKLTVTSWVYMNSEPGSGYDRGGFRRDWTAFGNPLGEMLFEGVRYFAGLAQPTNGDFSAATPKFYEKSTDNYGGAYVTGWRVDQAFEGDRADLYPKDVRPLPMITDWAGRPKAECAKPVILMISDIDNTFDGDDLYEIKGLPFLPSLQGKSIGLPRNLNVDGYLDKITEHEGYKGKQYYFAKVKGAVGRAVCESRTLTSLKDVMGLCPNEPSLEGSYSMAAVAHYAHTHDFSGGGTGSPIDVYTVGVTPALPALTFTVPSQSQTMPKITVMPTAAMNRTRDYLLSFIGYAVEYWKTDDADNSTPYDVRINVNYADESEVHVRYSDYEQDSTSVYRISLLNNGTNGNGGSLPVADANDNCTAANFCRSLNPVVIHSGPLKGYNPPATTNCYYTDIAARQWWSGGAWHEVADNGCSPTAIAGAPKFYRFVRGTGKMEIPAGAIKGLAVTSMILRTTTSAEIGLGYNITGTGNGADGTYIDVASSDFNFNKYPDEISGWEINGSPKNNNWRVGVVTAFNSNETDREGKVRRTDIKNGENVQPAFIDELFTPMGCQDASDTNAEYCGGTSQARARMRILQTRSFTFSPSGATVEYLPTPMELAAKYGGFADPDNDGLPDNNDTSTWAALEDDANGNPYYGTRPKNYFYVANLASLSDELGRAFEAIANSVTTGTVNSASINEVMGGGMTVKTQYHSTYTDPKDVTVRWLGNVYSLFIDAWANQREDTDAPNPKEGRILDIKKDRIIVTESDPVTGAPVFTRYADPYGNNTPVMLDKSQQPNSVEDLEAVWNTTRWLIGLANVTSPRAYKAAEAGRRVYSYFPRPDGSMEQPSDGAGFAQPVQLNDSYVFEPGKRNNAGLRALLRCADGNDAARLACAQNLIEYTLGVDKPGLNYRNRTVTMPRPWFNDDTPRVWRMGDVMNSNPIIVAEAGANHHLTYGDKSYLKYAERITGRRNMIYFGSNDGILHAVNAGFYGSLKLGQAAYFVKPVICDRDDWATIPTKPRVCDMITGPPEHELGAEVWGFIPQSILPHLKWATDPDFNHVYMVDLTPTIAEIRTGDPNDEWGGWRTVMIGGLRLGGRGIDIGTDDDDPEYVYSEYFALDITDPEEEPKLLWRYSGPELGQGISEPVVTRSGGNWYVVLPSGPTMRGAGDESAVYDGRSNQPAQVIVLDAKTGQRKDNGTLKAKENNSFFNNASLLKPLPFNVNNSDLTKVDWSHHVIYMGLSAQNEKGYNTGAVYRLQMVNAAGKPVPPAEWKLTTMFNPERPVTGAVNATYDEKGQLWIIFGTGRMWSQVDANPCGSDPEKMPDGCAEANTQYLYGVKEDMVTGDPTRKSLLTFKEDLQDEGDIRDVSRISVYTSGRICDLGDDPDKKACSASEIAAEGGYASLSTSLKSDAWRGYRRALNIRETIGELYETTTFELINTRPEIDEVKNVGSNVVVTVYVPSGDSCNPAGESFLVVLDSYTGLPAPYMNGYDLMQRETNIGDPDNPGGNLTLMTSVLKSGLGMSSNAYIFHIGTLTIYGNTSANTAENQMRLDDKNNPKNGENGGGGSGTGTISWREAVDTALPIAPEDLFDDLVE